MPVVEETAAVRVGVVGAILAVGVTEGENESKYLGSFERSFHGAT